MPRARFVLLAFLLYYLSALTGLSCSPAAGRASKDAPSAQAAKSASPLRITAPEEDAAVPERPFVAGRVKNFHAKVWVVVHPMEVSDYWIQQPVTVGEDGAWEVQIHVGRPGSDDVSKHFEIRALANPKATLRQGDRLGGWPDAQWYSQVVRVTRE